MKKPFVSPLVCLLLEATCCPAQTNGGLKNSESKHSDMKTCLFILACILFAVAGLAQTNPCVSPPANLVAWWPGDGNASDIAGTNNGSFTNGVTFSQGEVAQAFSFDGTNGYVEIPHSATLNLSFGHTVEMWVRVDAYAPAGKYSMLISKWVNSAEDKSLTINAAGKVTYYLYNSFGGVPLTSSNSLALGTWYHVAATYDGATAKIYINGVLDNSKLASGNVNDSSGKLYLGHNPGLTASGAPAVAFKGLVDEIGWYDRALTQSEIQAIYGAGNAGKCKPAPPTDILRLDIAKTNTDVVIYWTNTSATLQSSPGLNGGWSDVLEATSPWVLPPTNLTRFFRLCLMIPTTADYFAPSFTTSIGDPFGCGCTSPENPNSLGAGGAVQDNAMGNVLLHTGELTQDAVDLEIPGRGFNWRFERRYRSGMTSDGPMGQGWDFNYNRRLVVETNGNVLCVNGLGRVDRYTRNLDGTYQSPGGFYTRLTKNPDGSFTERDRHATTNSYSAPNGFGIAKLSSIVDRNGNQMAFIYNANGQLITVMDTLARSISYSYDAYGRLTTVTDFAGRSLKFTYDGYGNLVSATAPAVTGTPNGNDFPTGKTTRYTYSSGFADPRFNHNLLSVTAPNEVAVNGAPRLSAQYDTNPASTDADRLLSLRLGGTNATGISAGGTISYTYIHLGTATSNDVATAVFKNTVTNRNGNATEYRFNQLGNIVSTTQFTHSVRTNEPGGYVRTFAYNLDGELISQTNAELDSILFTFDSGNPDRLQQGNLLQNLQLPGPRGADQSQIVVSNTYETNFNFIATTTDARGNTMSFGYDADGNRTNIIHRIPSITETFEYNAFGQMTAHTLPANDTGYRRRDTMSYYSSGIQKSYLQNQIVDAANLNLTTTYEYDSTGNLTRTIDPMGFDTLYSVNSLNQVVRESSPQVSTPSGLVRYNRDTFYDANNNVVQIDVQNRDDTGAVVAGNPAFTTASTYDILNDLLTTTQERDTNNNVVTAYGYDANQNRTLTRFGEANAGRQTNNTVQTIYDERDMVFLERRAAGGSLQSTTQHDYDRNGNLTRTLQGIEDVAGLRVTTFAYDGYNRRTNTTDPMGNVSTFVWDGSANQLTNRRHGELTDMVGTNNNVRLAETTFTYDAMNRLVQTDRAYFDPVTGTNIAGGHALTKTIYSGTCQVFQTIDADGHTNTTSFDTANRPGLVTDAKSNTTAYAYDANGRVITITEVDKSDVGSPDQTFITRKFYDALGRITNSLNNLSNSTTFAYDSRNNLVASVDERGNVVRYDYDGLNRSIATTRFLTSNGLGGGAPAGTIVTSQVWDDDSRLLAQTDSNSNTTAYVYDPLGRTFRTVFADATTSTNSYDVHDNATLARDANGNVVTVTYDRNNQPISRVITRAPGVLGTLLEDFQYDGLSRLVSATDDDSTVIRNYDSLSHILIETQVLSGGPARTVTYTYDAEGNQLSCTYPGGRVITSTYDSLDRHLAIADGAGMIAQYSWLGPNRVQLREYGNGTRATYNYDNLRQMTLSAHDKILGGTPIDLRLYSWDPAHNQTAMNDQLAPGLDARSFIYDSVNRMTQSVTAVLGPTNRYTLDVVGNRLNVTGGTNAGSYTMNSASPPADRQMNQYTTTPFDTRAYDSNGNLTNTGSKRFVYDYRNQMIFFTNSAVGVSATYKYDALGRRIEKSSSGTTNRFYYSGWQEIEEQNGTNGTVATFVWGNGIDDLLEMDRGGQKYYFHADDLGSIRKVTDANTNIVEQYRYDDYGRPSFFNGAGASVAGTQIGNATLFTGRRYDAETGLYYYRTRYLDSDAGRFTTRDTIGIWGDKGSFGNGYTYGGNAPETHTDPYGELKNEDKCALLGAAFTIATYRAVSACGKWVLTAGETAGITSIFYGPDCVANVAAMGLAAYALWDAGCLNTPIITGGGGTAGGGASSLYNVSAASFGPIAPSETGLGFWAVQPTHLTSKPGSRPGGAGDTSPRALLVKPRRSQTKAQELQSITAQRADHLGPDGSPFLFGWCFTEKCRCKRDGGVWIVMGRNGDGTIEQGCNYPTWHPPYWIIMDAGTVVGVEYR
jgi:RHS repeat-associated protein